MVYEEFKFSLGFKDLFSYLLEIELKIRDVMMSLERRIFFEI